MKRLRLTPLLLLFIGLVAAGCANDADTAADATDEAGDDAPAMSAVAMLSPTEGYSAEGTVTFTQVDEGTRIEADLSGLAPGMHGFHIHETGDCSAPNASSADGHYNPGDDPHGAPDSPDGERHMGDLGNIEAGSDSTATYSRVDPLVAFDSIVGKAVIVHAGQDDLSSQPAGAAGDRVACGVIERQVEM